ncbi:MAG: hypothetical protein JWM42_1509 [Burkholderia sp.]|nr:hypothetical protein [Burkholderia sp.]
MHHFGDMPVWDMPTWETSDIILTATTPVTAYAGMTYANVHVTGAGGSILFARTMSASLQRLHTDQPHVRMRPSIAIASWAWQLAGH